MLSINQLSKSYGSNLALNQFTYKFDHGIYALLGPNGSGKSTLMNIITQNLRSDSGEVTLDGENTDKLGVKFREKLGFMPQYPGMYPSFSALDFLRYMAVLKGIPKKQADAQIDELLHAVELHEVRRHRIGSFSGGMKQRLALAQALLGNPEIVILDEPTAGLDPKQRIAIRNYIASVALNKTVIIATHVVSDVEFIAREAIMLKKGVISDSGSPYELTSKIEGQVWQTVVKPEEVQTTVMKTDGILDAIRANAAMDGKTMVVTYSSYKDFDNVYNQYQKITEDNLRIRYAVIDLETGAVYKNDLVY